MTSIDIVTVSIAFVSLIVSAVTAYYTLFKRYNATIFVRSRIALTHVNGTPCIVLSCEFSNTGAKSGSVEDFVLLVKYKDNQTRSINTYSFFPIFIYKDEIYSIFSEYSEKDFIPFQSILLPANSRLIRHIVFSPTQQGFTPLIGDIEIHAYFRNSEQDTWQQSLGKLSFDIEEAESQEWRNPQGKSVSIEASENYLRRSKLLKDIFG